MSEWGLTLGPVLPFSLSLLAPWSVPELAYCCCPDIPKSRLLDEALRSVFREHVATRHSGATPIFTDGSRSSTGIGLSLIHI